MIHFFSLVQNGMPFIKHHLDTFKKLSVPWTWHVAEGLSELKGDTSWSVPRGGHIDDTMHRNGLSVDGTTEYLDSIKDQIRIYRPSQVFWQGKCEMCNTIVHNLKTPGLLWQIDVDEFWTPIQIELVWNMFAHDRQRTAAWFWARYYVGHDLVISTRNGYANNPGYEWIRVWNFVPGMSFAAHEPPVLRWNGADVGRTNPFTHAETEVRGLVFRHYAYCLRSQLEFKEKYYGYAGAPEQWIRLQSAEEPVILLRNYLPWVGDGTTVVRVSDPSEKMPNF